MNNEIRTRFAPSPTGYLHVGGLRTALYAYLFAKHNGGKYVLRIEDTDQKRYVEGAVENLVEILSQMGLHHDEGMQLNGKEIGEFGPYTQSKRTDLYREHAEKLIESGDAYRCFCTKERLDEMREKQMANKQAPKYDRKCLHLPESEIKKKIEAGEKFVVRHKVPYEIIRFKDIVRKNVQFDGKTIDDTVLLKSDNFPTYHLANVVDDHFMKITHVIRGEEWLPSTPKHIALYKAFGWDAPQYAHLPLLLNEDKSKLSKRQGDVAVEDYLKKGYSKEALINFVAFLGWNPGNGEKQEIFSLKELEEIFELEKVHKAGAVFNVEKLDWINWRWNKEKYLETIEEEAKKIDNTVEVSRDKRGNKMFKFASIENENKFLLRKGELLSEKAEITNPDNQTLKALTTVEEKVLKDPKETEDNIAFYKKAEEFEAELLTHEKMKVDLEMAKKALKQAKIDLSELEDWSTQESIKQALVKSIATLEVKNGQVLWPLRAALSGRQFSPGVFEIAWVLEKNETLSRIETALNKF